MNATSSQINVRNGIALLLVVVIAALTASLLMTSLNLVIARPSMASSAIADEAAVLAENPELMVGRRYTADSETATEAAVLAENPELVASRRYAASRELAAQAALLFENSEIAAEAAVLAANPELMLSRGYVPPGGWTQRMPQHIKLQNKVDPDIDMGLMEISKPQAIQAPSTPDQLSSVLAANPELSVARRYAARGEIAAEAAFLSANPELMLSRRYVRVQNTADPDKDIGLMEFFKPQTLIEVSTADSLSSVLAANPELSAARRYAARGVIAAEAAFLAANPELTLARGYVPPGGWTRRMPQNLKLQNKVDPDTDIGLLEFFTPQTKGVSTSCSDVVNPDRVALDRNYGTFTSAWTNMVNPDRVELDRNYGTFTSAWTNCPSVLAANPELPVARRYAAHGEIAAEAAFLAANPELMLARRYVPTGG